VNQALGVRAGDGIGDLDQVGQELQTLGQRRHARDDAVERAAAQGRVAPERSVREHLRHERRLDLAHHLPAIGAHIEVAQQRRPAICGQRPGGARGHERLCLGAVQPAGELDQGLTHGAVLDVPGGAAADRPVAIKVLLHTTPETVRRFGREARLTARLQHPSIVPLYEIGHWSSGEPFFAMKLVEGSSFADAAARATTPNDKLALLPHLIAATEALAYAHENGVIHRDLKPSNVLVGPFGETVVIDWGLAKKVTDGDDESDRPDRHILEGTTMKPVKTKVKRVLVLSWQTIRALGDAACCCVRRGQHIPEVKVSNEAHTCVVENCVG
jgi:serine/threonine protein kinase